PDGQRFYIVHQFGSAEFTGDLTVLDLVSGVRVHVALPAPALRVVPGNDGRNLYVAGYSSASHQAFIWKIETAVYNVALTIALTAPAAALAISADSQALYILAGAPQADVQATIVVIDAILGQQRATLPVAMHNAALLLLP